MTEIPNDLPSPRRSRCDVERDVDADVDADLDADLDAGKSGDADASAESDLSQLRSQIISERKRLQGLVESLTSNFDDLIEAADLSPPDDEHDPEGHTIAFERSQLTGQREKYRQTLAELDAVEQRLGDVASARCEGCGAEVPLERRLAVPSTNHCVRCSQPTGPNRLSRP